MSSFTSREAFVSKLHSEALQRRINVPLTTTSPPGLIEANTVDPFNKSQKYALAWTYFCLCLLVLVIITRGYHKWTDKLRQAMHKNEVERFQQEQLDRFNQMPDWSNCQTGTATSDRVFFPDNKEEEKISGLVLTRGQSHWSSIAVINDTIALFRWIFYRTIPDIKYNKKSILTFPSMAVLAIIFVALTFVTLYCFLPQPLFWQSIRYGAPPLAVRAGMLAVAMTPWIIATSMKANLISYLTGIGHDRLGVFHRWGGYLCLFLCLVHTIPFYIQPVWRDDGMSVFGDMFPNGNGIIYGSGIAALVPIGWLCLGSLPFIRSVAYELFVVLHVPVAFVYVGMLFWHTKNYLGSWGYLYATAGIWVLCYILRLFKVNWANPWRQSWLIGDEAAVTLLAENAVRVTVPTQLRWKPGQYVYLRMPGISFFENHPFTISSLCSDDFSSDYGETYRDLTMVFRPFGGFTKKVLETAIAKGPFHTYRAYLEGPYGGMQRELAAFETVVLFAGGSGITAIVSQLLNLIKRMRDGKAVTKKIEVVWALRNLEAMDWFKEELRICRDHAPPGTVTCQFFVTKAKRSERKRPVERAPRPISNMLHDKLDGFVAGIAEKRNSAMIRDEANGDAEIERRLREEDEDAITSLPRSKHLQHRMIPPTAQMSFPPPPSSETKHRASALSKLEGSYSKIVSSTSAFTSDTHEATRRFFASAQSGRSNEDQIRSSDYKRSEAVPDYEFVPGMTAPSYNNDYFPSPPPAAYSHDIYRHKSVPTALGLSTPQDKQHDIFKNLQPTPPPKEFDIADPTSYPPPPPGGPPRQRPAPLKPGSQGSMVDKPKQSPELKLQIPGINDFGLSKSSMQHKGEENGSHSPNWPLPRDPSVQVAAKSHQMETSGTSAPKASDDAHVEPATPLPPGDFEFGFPSTPTELQKNLMRFAFMSSAASRSGSGGWSTSYGRPDLGYMLKEMANGGKDGRGIFGRRTCVFVCGPKGMRESVAGATAKLQQGIWGDDLRDEIVLYTENYAI